jgi:hypothetical protein
MPDGPGPDSHGGRIRGVPGGGTWVASRFDRDGGRSGGLWGIACLLPR